MKYLKKNNNYMNLIGTTKIFVVELFLLIIKCRYRTGPNIRIRFLLKPITLFVVGIFLIKKYVESSTILHVYFENEFSICDFASTLLHGKADKPFHSI